MRRDGPGAAGLANAKPWRTGAANFTAGYRPVRKLRREKPELPTRRGVGGRNIGAPVDRKGGRHGKSDWSIGKRQAIHGAATPPFTFKKRTAFGGRKYAAAGESENQALYSLSTSLRTVVTLAARTLIRLTR
jgi:hypothetical protein